MNKQDLKQMLEFAGVDVNEGKAKVLIEGTHDSNYGRRDQYDRSDRWRDEEDEARRDKIARKMSHGKSAQYTGAVMDFLNNVDEQEKATVQEFEAWARKNRPEVLGESQVDLTQMLEFAGVDVTKGKAKVLIEKALDEGWGAAGQKRQQEEMEKEDKKYEEKIKKDNPDALKAYKAWRMKGMRGEYAAENAVKKGMPPS